MCRCVGDGGRLQTTRPTADDSRVNAAVTRPVRACHLIHHLAPGGAEHVLVDLASVAAGTGMDMSVVSMMPLDGHRYPEVLQAAGVQVHSLELHSWWDPRGPRRLAALIDELAPDLLHSHLKHADVVAGRVAHTVGLPHVSTLHVIEDQVGGLAARKRDLAARARIRSASLTIAVSEALRSWYLRTYPEDPARVVTIHNGVPSPPAFDESDRLAVRSEIGVPPEAVMATMVAVMRPGKGHEVLLRAAAETDDVVFVIVGDGPRLTEVRRAAAGLGAGRVVFTGFREDVPRLLAASDIVVHPTLFDALPTALIQGLAAGIPAVASEVGGIPEIVTPGTGYLVPPGEPAALASSLRSLAGDADARRWMGKAARERFDEAFDGAAWSARLVATYRTLIG